MRAIKTTTYKMISVFLCMALLLVCLPMGMLTVSAASRPQRVVDPHTLDQWKNFFGPQTNHAQNVSLTTEYAGGIWTDKSVFVPNDIPAQLTNATYNGQSISVADKGDNFLVALSAMASNKQVKGYSTIPTDTVLVLDLSSSMRYTDDNGGSAVDELVEATNKAISDLLALNRNNRVAVVVYAGNINKNFSSADGITRVVLPLDSYTAPTAGEYLVSARVGYNNHYALEVKAGVKNAAGNTMNTNRFEVSTGTYMQDGIYEAMKLLLNADPVVRDGVQTGTKRMPIMVLMTDGEPTLANNDYNGNDARTDLGVSNLETYNGNTGTYSHRDTIAFVTSLTAAFAKKQIAAHYGTSALMYTLPYGNTVFNRPEALSVLNPARASDVQNSLWKSFLDGEQVTVFRSGYNPNYQYLTTSNSSKTSERLVSADRMYVDKYFPAKNDDAMLESFESIVDEIIIQSKYYPTYVEKDHDHDGYLTFADKIGSYMEVSDITGIVIGNRLFSGAALASKFPADADESIVASNVLGDALLNSVKVRLGIEDDAVAAALVQDAHDHGQLIYTDADNYDHYIGWFSDAAGTYVDFWHKDMTPAEISEVQSKGATHIIRSYAFLGDTAVVPGVSNTDMMYMSVRVATEIATGESVVTWRIPASLVPTLTYEVEVEVDSDGEIIAITDLGLESDTAESPIRLLYEVELRGDITDWNVVEKLDNQKGEDYVAQNGYTFYSNKWNPSANDTVMNTYSHFEPSTQNERYYYTQDATVMVKTGIDTYTPYEGGTKPTGDGYYHVYQVFEKLENGTLRTHNHYEPISAEAMQSVKAGSDNQWFIPKDTVHRYYDYEIAPKEQNDTATMAYSDHPFVIKSGATYYTYSTQGNNGKLTLTPATGLRLTKNLAEGYASDATFTFVVAGGLTGAQVVRLDAAGYETSRTTLPNNGEVALTAGETVYIVGLTAGDYTVTEKVPNGADYRVQQVKVNGQTVTGTVAQVAVADQTIATAEFTNGPLGYGGLIVSKDVTHPFDVVPDALTNKSFTIHVDLDGEGVAEQTFTASGVQGVASVETDVDGVFTVQLRDGESVTVQGLPEDTTYTITETLTAADAGYSVDMARSVLSGTIRADATALGHVINRYNPAPAEQTLTITGTKTVTDETGTFDWTDKSFSFKLESYNPSTGAYTQIGQNATVAVNGGSYTFPALRFDTLGTYHYKVSEVIPAERLDGMSYDASVGRVVVHVTDNDMDGKMEVDVRDYTTDQSLTANNNVFTFTKNFVNVHTADATFVEFTVDKKVTDPHNTNVNEAGFLFGLYKVENGVTAAEPSYTMRTVGSDGKATFHIPLNKVTEDTYLLKEIQPAQQDKIPGMLYDTTEYTVLVKAETKNSKLVPSVAFSKDGQNVAKEDLVFDNKMQLTPASSQFEVNKVVEGDPITNEDFTFTLTETDGSFVAPKAGGVSDQVKIAGSGKKSFAAIAYTAVGTHYYVVKELPGTRGGMTYDGAEYHITVNVTVNGNALVADTTVNKLGVGAVQQLLFTNIYTLSGDTSVVIEGTKTLVGRPLLNGEFKFRLVQVADANGTAMNNPFILETNNGAAVNNRATFRFAPITYTQVGDYFYRVSEIAGPSGNGVTYSDVSYIVKVVVQDNGSGGYASSWSVQGNDPLSFVNTYHPRDGYTDVLGSKELTGKTLSDGQFTFVLTETESDFTTVVAGGENREVSNDVNGAIRFGRLTYTTEGTYYYVVREKIPVGDKLGIVYDETEYRVKVLVEDHHAGVLETTTTIQMVLKNGTTISTSSIAFNNEYQTTAADAVISGSKVLEGGDLEADAFRFNLYQTDDTYDITGLTPVSFVKNEQDGSFCFTKDNTPALHYEQVGTYYYVLIEDASTPVEGIVYDTTVYQFEVTVTDNGIGALECTIACVNGDANRVIFRNVVEEEVVETPDTPDTPDVPATTPYAHSPQTGDGFHVQLWIALLFVSGGGLVVAAMRGRKREES